MDTNAQKAVNIRVGGRVESECKLSPVFLTRTVAAVALASLLCSGHAHSQISFEDVSDEAMDEIATESWGLSVGDYNGDGWQDVFVTNHRDRSSLHRNNGDGSFTDVMLYADKDKQFTTNRFIDHHRGVFSDVDNDGDDDLVVLQLTRGNPDNTPNNWHRLPLFSHDGYLTLEGSRTSDGDGWTAEYDCDDGHADWFFPMYGDLDGDDVAEYMCVETGKFQFISPGVYNGLDYAFEDLDNDLRPEIFAMIGGSFIDDAEQVSPTRAEAFLQYTSDIGASTMRFEATPPVTFTIYHKGLNETVTLSGGSHLVNTVGISYDPGDNYWTVEGVNNDTRPWTRYKTAYVVAEAPSGVSHVSISNELATSAAMLPRVMKVEDGSFKNRTWSAGFREEVRCDSVVIADLDNDKDQDIYLTCREGVENTPNRLYLNDGSGFFTEVTGVGAEGRLGRGIETNAGTAESAVVFDYDNNGFLDLMVTNGKSVQPIRTGGAPSLLRNLGNDNNWIQLILSADGLNYSAVGTRVVATSGGVSQLRYQNAGLHRYSQNQQRIHFGLGGDESVDLEIRWPDGSVQTIDDVAANRIYRLHQGDAPSVFTAGTVPTFEQPTNTNGGACGTPPYLKDRDQDLFLYQTDCGSDRFSMRVTGGSTGVTEYQGRLVALNGTQISSIENYAIESHDSISVTSTEVVFDLRTARNDQDGFDFTLVGSDACLFLTAPARSQLLVGGRALPVDGRGVNPKTLQSCTVAGFDRSLSMVGVDVSEGDGVATIDVLLNAPATNPVSVKLATRAETATAPQDFYGTFRQLVFSPGEVSKSVDIEIVNDTTSEDPEKFSVRLFDAEGAIVATAEVDVTVTDDDDMAQAVFSVGSASIDEGAGSASVVVSLSQALPEDSTVRVATASGSAVPRQDFYGLSQSLVFAAGETSKTIDIVVIDDNTIEGDEQFTVRLFSPTIATIGNQGSAVVTIVDNDTTSLPALGVQPISVDEGVGDAIVAVTLSAPSTDTVTVRLSTVARDATQGMDYYGTFKILNFAPGETSQTVALQIIDDAVANEGTERFDVRLFNPSGATIETARTPVSIVDND